MDRTLYVAYGYLFRLEHTGLEQHAANQQGGEQPGVDRSRQCACKVSVDSMHRAVMRSIALKAGCSFVLGRPREISGCFCTRAGRLSSGRMQLRHFGYCMPAATELVSRQEERIRALLPRDCARVTGNSEVTVDNRRFHSEPPRIKSRGMESRYFKAIR